MELQKIAPLDTFSESKTHLQGTVKELVSCGISVNGIKLDKADLGVLLNLGMGKCLGEVDQASGTRGKAPKVYSIAKKQDCIFTAANLDFNFVLGSDTV